MDGSSIRRQHKLSVALPSHVLAGYFSRLWDGQLVLIPISACCMEAQVCIFT
jgi:hypothetical protein